MQQDVLELAKQLIAIPSEKDNPLALNQTLDIAKKLLSDFTIRTFERKGSPSLLISNQDAAINQFKVIFNAHLDVVPGKNSQFEPKVENGKLVGRGSYDMKAAAAVMILLFKETAKHVDYPFALQLVTDEEIGGFNGTKHQVDEGIRGDFIIAGENTDLMVNNASKGIIWLNLKTHGKAAHGAYPWLGENAIWKMNHNLTAIEEAFPIPTVEAWQTTINLSKVSTTNTTFNKVPDEAEAGFDIRYVPVDEPKIVDKIVAVLTSDTEHEVLVKEPSHFADPNGEYMKRLLQSIETVTGEKGTFVQKHGGSDVRFYSPHGCEGVTYGPTGFGHHSDDEWVDIKSLETYFEILRTFVTK